MMLAAMAHHRNTVSAPIRLMDDPDLEKCVNSKEYRVMMFCADSLTGPQDITFPHSSEIKVNGGEVKANLRGLKKKPGSTRPVDITDNLRLRGSYVNNVEFTYALTTKVDAPLVSAPGLATALEASPHLDTVLLTCGPHDRSFTWPSTCAR